MGRGDDDARGDALPLAPVWKAWLRNRDDSMRDPDGAELLRLVAGDRTTGVWKSDVVKTVCGLGPASAGANALHILLEWAVVWDPPLRGFDLLLDGLENAVADFSEEEAVLMRMHEGNPAQAVLRGDKNPALT